MNEKKVMFQPIDFCYGYVLSLVYKNVILLEINILQICSLLRGGIAERGGVRVGHRIIDINSQSVVAVPHEKIVNLLATSVGEVRIFSECFSELLLFFNHLR